MNDLHSEAKAIVSYSGIKKMMDRYHYSEEIRVIIENENLLPAGLIIRLHSAYPVYSGIFGTDEFIFSDIEQYVGLKGFRDIVQLLGKNNIHIGHIEERELYIKAYRFLATKHSLNSINWKNFEKDSVYQLIIPQPGMIPAEVVSAYKKSQSEEEKETIVKEYIKKTNPHDGKQKLNKPWYIDDEGQLQVVEGSQHKYPPCQLIFDKSTQNCFSFCTYCFRHAQVRGDEDMFVQEDIGQVHDYLKRHKEVSDVIITGGDAGHITYERLSQYVNPIIEDPGLLHIKTIRFGSRLLTYQPELIFKEKYNAILALFKKLIDNGIQVVWMSHFSTPREVLNPVTIAAIRRLRAFGVTVKSQSPIMNHISLFKDENGKTDIDRSAQNWIDLGNILAMLGVGFHSIYCARPTGEHHYFTAPLAEINKVFCKIYSTLSSINRPSRYITMTSSGGKTSLLGTAEVNGETVFALKFNESRNMDWMDKVFLAKYDEKENTIEKLKPYQGDKFFFEDELIKIERDLHEPLEKQMKL